MNLSPCEHYRDYIYISDVVKGIQLISDLNESTIVNLGSGKAVQLRDFVKRFWQRLGGELSRLNFGAHSRPGHEPVQPYCFSDQHKLKKLTNWTPSVLIDDGIKETVAVLRGDNG